MFIVAVFTMSKEMFQNEILDILCYISNVTVYIYISITVGQQWCLLNLGIGILKNHSFCESCSKTVQELIGQGQASVSLGK